MQGINGSGITVAIVDNGNTNHLLLVNLTSVFSLGVDMNHDDLAPNFVSVS